MDETASGGPGLGLCGRALACYEQGLELPLLFSSITKQTKKLWDIFKADPEDANSPPKNVSLSYGSDSVRTL